MIIQVEGLTKSFGTTKALKGITFEVPEKKIVGFLGPNGAGKSTTIGIIMQMIKPDSGKVLVFGEDVSESGHRLRRDIGLIPDASLPNISGKQLLKHTGWIFDLRGKALENRINEVVHQIGGSSFYQRNTKTMSKGQRQRIKIANALISDPKLIIADEPTAGLDPVSRQTLLNLFLQLVEKEDKTIFFSNHVISEVEKISDHLIILNQGEIKNKGSMEEIKSKLMIPGVYRLDIKDTGLEELETLSGVQSVVRDTPTSYTIRTSSEENNVPDFLKDLIRRDIRIDHYSRKLVQLEDVFMEAEL